MRHSSALPDHVPAQFRGWHWVKTLWPYLMEYRGRVLAVYSMFWGLTPIGSLEVGLLSRSIGVQNALAINGCIIFMYMLFLWFRTPVRHID